jgi:hypothetical protein
MKNDEILPRYRDSPETPIGLNRPLGGAGSLNFTIEQM